MILKNKNAIIYGGGGAIGSAVALAFAKEGARLFLAGRTEESLNVIAQKIKDIGGYAEITVVDALDKKAVDKHHENIFKKEGTIDIAINAIGEFHIQGIPLIELSLEDFHQPLHHYTIANFITATAAARYMVYNKSGIILTISTIGALMANGVSGGFNVANSAVESISLKLAGELGQYGIRVICLRPDAIPEAVKAGSHAKEVFGHRAKLMGITLDELLSQMPERTLLNRMPTLDDIAETAVFMASDKASAITATVINLSCGSIAS